MTYKLSVFSSLLLLGVIVDPGAILAQGGFTVAPDGPPPATIQVVPLEEATVQGSTKPGRTRVQTTRQLPGVVRYQQHDKIAARLSQHVVQIRVMPKRPKYIRSMGDPAHYGAATLVAQKDQEPVLITGEYFVRNAESLELMLGSTRCTTNVVEKKPQLGLAVLSIPPECKLNLKPAPLSTGAPTPNLYALTFDQRGVPTVRPAQIGPRGNKELAFYHQASPSLGGGHPIFDQEGNLRGLYALQLPQHKHVGFLIPHGPIEKLLSPPEERKTNAPLNLDIQGGRRIQNPTRKPSP